MEHLLEEHGVKPTPNRLLVARALAGSHRPLSLKELEERLETIDKSNIFRALTVFRDARLVHVLDPRAHFKRPFLCVFLVARMNVQERQRVQPSETVELPNPLFVFLGIAVLFTPMLHG